MVSAILKRIALLLVPKLSTERGDKDLSQQPALGNPPQLCIASPENKCLLAGRSRLHFQPRGRAEGCPLHLFQERLPDAQQQVEKSSPSTSTMLQHETEGNAESKETTGRKKVEGTANTTIPCKCRENSAWHYATSVWEATLVIDKNYAKRSRGWRTQGKYRSAKQSLSAARYR